MAWPLAPPAAGVSHLNPARTGDHVARPSQNRLGRLLVTGYASFMSRRETTKDLDEGTAGTCFWPPDDRPPTVPLPRADRRPLIDPQAWLAAQANAAADLARAAMAVGRLDEAAAAMGQGAPDRLALLEVEAMLWAAGTPIRREQIGRDLARAPTGADLHAHRQARWALRRLGGQGALHDLRDFLGLHRTGQPGLAETLAPRPMGVAFDNAAASFGETMDRIADAHPFTRGAFACQVWRLADLSPGNDLVEAATWSARAMAADCGTLHFVGLGAFGRKIWHGAAPVADRLRDHYRAIADAATAARATLRRLADWETGARAASARIKGDTPARVIAALLARPLSTTEDVATAAAVSRDTAERMLARLTALGIAREVTATRRFRLWAAGA